MPLSSQSGLRRKTEYRDVCARVEFAAQQCGVDFRRGVAGDKFGVLEIQKVGEESSGDIGDMSHRLGADPKPDSPEFFEIVQPSSLLRVDREWLTLSGEPR